MDYSAQWIEIGPNLNKFVHSWIPAEAPVAVISIVHGLGEHGGRYHSLAQAFVAAGFAVVAFDQQGHGQSPEPRGCIVSYSSLLDDIEKFYQWSSQQYPHAPAILFGHSMGGNLVLNYALRKFQTPTGVIASSPMIKAVREPGWLFKRVGQLLVPIVPNYRLQSKIIVERLMSDPQEQAALLEDELFHAQLSLRLGEALLTSGDWLLGNAHRLSIPLLLTHGTEDTVTSHTASEEFGRLAGEDCRLTILPGAMHDPFRDLDKEDVIERFIGFVQQLRASEIPL
jgi:alpha-beta hydrolase superfamily lysophospholipase